MGEGQAGDNLPVGPQRWVVGGEGGLSGPQLRSGNPRLYRASQPGPCCLHLWGSIPQSTEDSALSQVWKEACACRRDDGQ